MTKKTLEIDLVDGDTYTLEIENAKAVFELANAISLSPAVYSVKLRFENDHCVDTFRHGQHTFDIEG